MDKLAKVNELREKAEHWKEYWQKEYSGNGRGSWPPHQYWGYDSTEYRLMKALACPGLPAVDDGDTMHPSIVSYAINDSFGNIHETNPELWYDMFVWASDLVKDDKELDIHDFQFAAGAFRRGWEARGMQSVTEHAE